MLCFKNSRGLRLRLFSGTEDGEPQAARGFDSVQNMERPLLHVGPDEDEENWSDAKAPMVLPAGEGRNEEASGQGQPGREAAAAEGEGAGELSGEGPSAADAAGLEDGGNQEDHGAYGGAYGGAWENEQLPREPVHEGMGGNEGVPPPPVPAPMLAPVPGPVPAPMLPPVPAPVPAPMLPPVPAPVPAPMLPPVPAPMLPPVPGPVPAPMLAPVPAPVPAPVLAPVPVPVLPPMLAPMLPPVPAPMLAPVPAPVPAPMLPPVPGPVPAPMLAPVPAPMLAPVPAPRCKRASSNRFAHWQRHELESVFQHTHYITADVRKQLAASMGVSEAKVQNWFKKKREQYRKYQKP